METNHNIKAIQLNKQIVNKLEINIREVISMFKDRNNFLNWDSSSLQNKLLKLL